MRICVFGAGSLGSALGGLLSSRNEVSIVGRRPHVLAVAKHGLRLTGDVRRVVRLAAFESIQESPPAELLIITTKAYDTEEAVTACRKWLKNEALVLTLQNGLGNLELLRAWKRRMALGGTTTLGASLTSPGIVRISGIGETVIGSDLNPDAAKKVAEAFNASGIPARIEHRIDREIWSKAIVSSCINPTTAVLRVQNGALLKSGAIRRLLDEICDEGTRVARASKVNLNTATLQERVRAVARDTSRNTSSMLQDVERGRRTEIAQINGAICRLGKRLGVASPLNLALTSMVESLEPATRREKG